VRLVHGATGAAVTATERRSQARNRAAALLRLRERLAALARRPKRRRKTAPTRASRERRLSENVAAASEVSRRSLVPSANPRHHSSHFPHPGSAGRTRVRGQLTPVRQQHCLHDARLDQAAPLPRAPRPRVCRRSRGRARSMRPRLFLQSSARRTPSPETPRESPTRDAASRAARPLARAPSTAVGMPTLRRRLQPGVNF
jgi:hypothetical protein